MKKKWQNLFEWAVLIGAVNWLLVVFNFNLVQWIADITTLSWVATIIYVLVGIGGIMGIYKKFK